MTPKRWKQIDDLAQAALERGGEDRAAFLDEACAGDEALRREVESQIAYQQQASKFLEEPAFRQAAELMADSHPETESMEGRIISHYSILRKLGEGGMGEVYLAHDTTLNRKVAIKFLSRDSVAGEQGKKRLVREARAAAALDHPHICAVHEVGEEAGHNFIVMQYVEGETLADRMRRKPFEFRDALDVAVQIADALADAHLHRVIHRDVKPQNVMLTVGGQVKVLDFGLAKLMQSGELDSIGKLTKSGAPFGTPTYMSPEQARGDPADTRSDLFSLGVTIYEMVTNRLPFEGNNAVEVMHAVLKDEPAPLGEYTDSAPPELERIISKTLRKDPEKRYQRADELSADLKNLKEQLTFEKKLGKSKSPRWNRRQETANRAKVTAVGHQKGSLAAGSDQADTSAIGTNRRGAAVPSPVVTSPPALMAVLRHRRKKTSALAIVAFVGLAILVALLLGRSGPAPASSAPAATGLGRSLSYWIMVQKYRGSKPYQDQFRLKDDMNFEEDYRIRINISSSQSGYLYLLNEGPATTGQPPTFVVMFPSETVNNGSAQLTESHQIQIPQQSWFQFDQQRGTETIWLVWADHSVDELEEVKGLANPKDRGFVASPALRAAVHEFLRSHSSLKPSVERDEDRKETVVRATGDMLVHAIKLEHH